jgi:hypothetical protein
LQLNEDSLGQTNPNLISIPNGGRASKSRGAEEEQTGARSFARDEIDDLAAHPRRHFLLGL